MQTIIVDMTPGFRMPTIYYSQGDVGTQFAIDLRSRFGDSFPTGTTVTIQATKPSGFGFSVAATSVTNGVATFTTTAEMTDEFGRFPAELKVTKTGLTLFSANFYMDGERNTHPEGTTDGSQETVIPELAQLVERVEDAASSVLDMTVNATTLAAGSQATYSYDEETNTATFGIPQGEAGAGAAGVVASAYSASSTYAVGDYVIHNSNLYRCTTAITTAEAFTAAHWTQVVLADDVSDLKSALNATGIQEHMDANHINLVADIATNLLEGLPIVSGYVYDHGAHTKMVAADNVVFPLVRVDAGKTYYCRRVRKYFSTIKYDDGTYEALSNTDGSPFYGGSFIPSKNGWLAVTALADRYTSAVITTSEEMYSNPNQLTAYSSQSFDNVNEVIEKIADVQVNLLDGLTHTSNMLYNHGDHTTSANALCTIFPLIRVKANTTYYVRRIWKYFCTIKYDDNTYESLASTDVGSPFYGGSFIPSKNGWLAVTVLSDRYDTAVVTTSEKMYNNANEVNSYAIPTRHMAKPRAYYVEKDGSGDFTKITDAITEATKYMDSVIYLGAGTFDIIDELGADYIDAISSSNRGLYLKNRVHIIGSSNSKITCHYTGSNATVRAWICIFNSGEHGFTLENVTLEGSNLRYLVHDERDTDSDAYSNKYINCYMDFYNEDRSVSSQCIGAGLGLNGEIVLDGCVFKSYQSRFPVTIHNSAGANAKSHIVVKNCLFDGSADDLDYHKGSIRVNYYGQSELITHVEVSGCSLWEQPVSEAEVVGSSPYVNVAIKAWANEIRGN